MNDKRQIREKLKVLRSELPEEKVRRDSKSITEKLLDSLDWRSFKKAHIYDSVANWKEVDTHLLKSKLKESYPWITIISPGLKKDQRIPSEKFDLIIVPILGFDRDNHRLGLGGGWYDRFLAQQPEALKIGLAWQACFVEKLPYEVHDIVLDKIITEV